MARIAVLVGPEFEDPELSVPVERLHAEGHEIGFLGAHGGQELVGRRRKVSVVTNAAVTERRPDMYDALLIPGGRSPGHLRTNADVVQFVREFAATGRPIAAVCHGPQLLEEAGLVAGVRMTAYPSVREELRAAGAEVVDEPVVIDRQFITSRNPDDLEVFSTALLQRLEDRERLEVAAPEDLATRPQA